MKKRNLLLFSTFFLVSFQSYSAPLTLEDAQDMYAEAQATYDNAYDIMVNESDSIGRDELEKDFAVERTTVNDEDTAENTLVKNEQYITGEREDYRDALMQLGSDCGGKLERIRGDILRTTDSDIREELGRAESLYQLCERQTTHELEYFF